MAHEADPKMIQTLADELSLPRPGVAAVLQLLADGNTVPFIARYRKEMTGGLDEVQIRNIEERNAYRVELEDRRRTILETIEGQGKLTPALRRQIEAAETKSVLEDLYLPYKPKRRTRATIARERGLEPLAQRLLEQPASGDPWAEAQPFADARPDDLPDAAAALAGARDIVAEMVAEHADVRAFVRGVIAARAAIVSSAVPEKTEGPTKYEQYYDHDEPIARMPSHRYLAIRRGEREGILRVGLEVDTDQILDRVRGTMGHKPGTPFAGPMADAIEDAYKRLLAPSVGNDVRADKKVEADHDAVRVFADNMRPVLMAAPVGTRGVIGLDPGYRTGCKCAVVDATGKVLDTDTSYPTHGGQGELRAQKALTAWIDKYRPFAVAVGNGTAGRETEAFAKKSVKAWQQAHPGEEAPVVVSVNESGASVYSASDVARAELPDLDVSIRGAVSIARRLQDPLAELVKIDPKAIGVGQYQHDVHQPLLARKLDEVIESCVNQVGVDANTASPSLLSRVAGIGSSLAKKIVKHRDDRGAFSNRDEILGVPGLGPKTFVQAAGFLRVRGGHPLDASAVHPERYGLVERMARDIGVPLEELVGNESLADRIDLMRYVDDSVGLPTLRDIIDELKKPGRDPREKFEPPAFRDDVQEMSDLKVGMVLEGVVTNVTAFGAFVDVGVHQDGLVHISQLADRFVRDPNEVVKAGDKLKVRVLSVDLERKRISMSAKSPEADDGDRPVPRDDGPDRRRGQGKPRDNRGRSSGKSSGNGGGFRNNPFADLLGPRRDR